MVCYSPMLAYRSSTLGETGKYGMTFSGRKALREQGLIKLHCGKCIGCRKERMESWGIRGFHEAQVTKFEGRSSCFVTLTFDDEHLPDGASLDRRELSAFLRRLRKAIAPTKVRFFGCGEYGERNRRMHYHVILFGYDFPDKKFYRTTKSGHRAYVSEQLSELWPFGLHEIGDVTFQSARYVSAYVTNRQGGSKRKNRELVTIPHPLTGELVEVESEFQLQSLRPGIGDAWFERFKSDVYPSDEVIVDGRVRPMPRYYFLKLSEEEQKVISRQRRAFASKSPEEQAKARLLVKEELAELRLQSLVRDGE